MPAVLDLTDQRFGRLVALRFYGYFKMPSSTQRQWWCKCDRGTELAVLVRSLTSGNTQSCGCHNIDSLRNRKTHGRSGTPEHRIWKGIINRCENPKTIHYKNYGGRGITICEKWRRSFQAFFNDMGERPSKAHTIERKNNSVGYRPGNCVWATRGVQNKNQRQRTNNTSGTTGVSWHSRLEKWQAYIGHDKTKINLGTFDTIEAASLARKAAMMRLDFSPTHGEPA